MDNVIFRDGFGERRRLVNNSHTARLDVLYLDRGLTSAPAFEAALRARHARLAAFRHPQFATVRDILRVGDGLAIAADVTPGLRLSELFSAAGHTLAFDTNTAVFLIRQLVGALAAFHDDGEDLAHGAIALERLVLTPDARLIVVEPILGPAIEELQFPYARLWKDLRVACPRTTALPQLDQRADVMQLGIVALSLVLARPIADDEYPDRIEDLIATATAVFAQGGFEAASDGFRTWLARALQVDIRTSFASALEAQTDLNQILEPDRATTPSLALKTFLGMQMPATESSSIPVPVRAPIVPTTVAAPPTAAPLPDTLAVPAPVPISTAIVAAAGPPSVVPKIDMSGAPGAMPVLSVDAPKAASRIVEAGSDLEPPAVAEIRQPPIPVVAPTFDITPFAQAMPSAIAARGRLRASRKAVTAVAAGALIVLASAGVLATRRHLTPAPATSAGTLAITTNPNGATVIVDGQSRGVTPLTVRVSPGTHLVELLGQGERRRLSVAVAAGAEVSQYIELPKSVPTLGNLYVTSEPKGAHVSVDGIPHGDSPVTVAGLTPGEHTVLVNSEAGSTTQTVMIDSGVTASLTAQLSNQSVAPGWISVSAPQEVQLFENGRLVGSSQTDKLMVLAGSHQLELVNQAIGYRGSKTVQVTGGKTSTIKVEFPNGTIALNAAPWAEVWIDGTRIGETPVGNLPIAVGSHEVVFRHPELGEQRHVATVTLHTPTRLSVDMRKK